MASEVELERMIVRLLGDASSYLKMLEEAKKASEDAAKKIQNSGEKIEAFRKKLEAFGHTLSSQGKAISMAGAKISLGLTTPLTALGAFAIKAGSDFESGFAGVRKTVDATEEEFAVLEQGFKRLAETTPVPVGTLLGIGEVAGQLGILKPNILEFTRVMAEMDVATNLSSEEAATEMARFGNITGLAQGDMEKLGSSIVSLGNKFETNEREIMNMSMRLAGAGKTIGMSAAEITGLGAAFASVGLEPEMAGTAFSTFVLTLQGHIARGSEELKNFAGVARMSVEEFSDLFRTDAKEAILALMEGLNTLDPEERTLAIESLGVEGARMRDVIIRSSLAVRKLRSAMDEGNRAFADGTALHKEAAERFKTFASQAILLRNSLVELGDRAFRAVKDDLLSFIKTANDLVRWMIGLDTSTVRTIVILGATAAAIGPVVVAFGTFIWALGQSTLAFTTLWKAATPGFSVLQTLASWYMKLRAKIQEVPLAKNQNELILYNRNQGSLWASVRQSVADAGSAYTGFASTVSAAITKVLGSHAQLRLGVQETALIVAAAVSSMGSATAEAGTRAEETYRQLRIETTAFTQETNASWASASSAVRMAVAGMLESHAQLRISTTQLTTTTSTSLTQLATSHATASEYVDFHYQRMIAGQTQLRIGTTAFVTTTGTLMAQLAAAVGAAMNRCITDIGQLRLTTSAFVRVGSGEVRLLTGVIQEGFTLIGIATTQLSTHVQTTGLSIRQEFGQIAMASIAMARAITASAAQARIAMTGMSQGMITTQGPVTQATQSIGSLGTTLLGLPAPAQQAAQGATIIDAEWTKAGGTARQFKFDTEDLVSKIKNAGAVTAVFAAGFRKLGTVLRGLMGLFRPFALEIALIAGPIGLKYAYRLGEWLSGVTRFNNAIAESNRLMEKQIELQTGRQQKELAKISGISHPGLRVSALQEALKRAKIELDGYNVRVNNAKENVRRLDTTWNNLRKAASLKAARHQLESVQKQADVAARYVKELEQQLAMGQSMASVSDDPLGTGTGETEAERRRREAQQELNKDLEDYKKKLELQRDTIGMTAEEAQIYELRIRGANTAVLDSIAAEVKAREEKQRLHESLKDLNKDLMMQAATFGMTSREADIFRLQTMGATNEQLKLANALNLYLDAREKEKRLMDRGKSLTKQFQTPTEKYKDAQKELNDMLAVGAIGVDTYTRALQAAQKELAKDYQADFSVKGVDAVTAGSAEAIQRLQEFAAGRGAVAKPDPKMVGDVKLPSLPGFLAQKGLSPSIPGARPMQLPRAQVASAEGAARAKELDKSDNALLIQRLDQLIEINRQLLFKPGIESLQTAGL